MAAADGRSSTTCSANPEALEPPARDIDGVPVRVLGPAGGEHAPARRLGRER